MVNYSLRFKFERGEEVKFISHLDLMKVFERALRRADISVAHSQGFNPHPHIVFGLPLSVGVVSEGEYADIDLNHVVSPKDFIERLNSQLPQGLKILEAKEKKAKGNIMASIDIATYDCVLTSDMSLDYLDEKILELLEKNALMVKKESKKGIKYIDIRPMIHNLQLCENLLLEPIIQGRKVYSLTMLVSAGSRDNLKPELLIDALKEIVGAQANVDIAKVIRTGLFIKKDEKMLSPLDDCLLIAI